VKKRKKSPPAAKRRTLSPQGSSLNKQPPESFINEIANLINAGDWALFEQKAMEATKRWPMHPFGWKALANFLLMQGRLEDALVPLAKSVQLAPDDFQILNNIGSVFLELGRLEEAEANFRQALELNPDYALAYNNLGIALLKQGQHDESAASYRKALALKPDFAEAHNNLGNVLKELGKTDAAMKCFQQALLLNPNFSEAYCNLANIYLKKGRLEKAKANYSKSLALKPDYARAHSGLGETLLKQGQLRNAIASFRKCIELDSSWVKAHEGLNKALGQLIPPWHVPMMNDRFRNDAYYAALKNAITPDTHVLEIGTGAGLLAMMSARLGAKQVTTCEAIPEIAETAQDIIKENGLSPPVTVVPKISSKMKVGKDMDERADLLVSEILSSEFLGEGVIFSIEDAKRRLLKPDAKIIPARGSIQFALIGGADIEKNLRVDEVYGFNFSKFNEIVAKKQLILRSDLTIEMLSDDTCAFFFDFINIGRIPFNEQKSVEVTVRKTGRCCGIIQWIRLEMDDTVVFENHPSVKNPAAGWQHTVYVFPSTIDLVSGQVANITVAHDRDTPWFFFDGFK